MATASRIPIRPPTRVARRRGRVLATALAGGLAGLAVGVACVAWAPQVGRVVPRPGVARTASASGTDARSPRPAISGVARVLAPARDAGVASARAPGGEDGTP